MVTRRDGPVLKLTRLGSQQTQTRVLCHRRLAEKVDGHGGGELLFAPLSIQVRAVKEYLATLDDVAFGAASDVTPKFVSPSGPAAQWTGAMRGPAFFAYADNYLIDVKVGVIMDVEASRAIRQG